MKTPHCPYCSAEMVHTSRLKVHSSGVGVRWQVYFYCPCCHSRAPLVLIDSPTEEEAIEAARKVATQKG